MGRNIWRCRIDCCTGRPINSQSIPDKHERAVVQVERNKRDEPKINSNENKKYKHDGGGSNSSKGKLWKFELQKFSNETGMKIEVVHFPPGTSKWNKIEHRLFSYISKNWRGKPLISYEVIIKLISSTKTAKGLDVECEIDNGVYKTGINITKKQMGGINIIRSLFHGEWNYSILPQ